MAHRLPFSSWYRFRVTRPLVFEGRAYTYNEAIPAAAQARMSARLLRQLYEQRRIDPLPMDAPEPTIGPPGDGTSSGALAPAEDDERDPGPIQGAEIVTLPAESDLATAQRLHEEGVARRSRRKISA